MSTVVNRFIRYAKIDTQSDYFSQSCPSTQKQFDLARLVADELRSIGLEDISLDEKGYLMATLPANTDKETPVLGLIAHFDTSPDLTGTNVNPQIVTYQGGDLILDENNQVILSPKEFPDLEKYVGQTLITTDGTTLLGADDKAGIAEIVTAMEYLVNRPEIKRGKIRIGITPDEEIGRGPDHFDLEKFGADFAYTIDGGELGELQYENFNAAEAWLHIHGRSVHPGSARNKMVNSIWIAMEFANMLPAQMRPEYTDNYEGFFHIDIVQGGVDKTSLRLIIRDHNRDKFNEMKRILQQAVAFLNAKHGPETIELTITDQYYNMREKVEPVQYVINIARQAFEDRGIQPLIIPIRGGTDGARLSYRGLPTPNIFAGGHNFHGRYEYIPTASMDKAVEVIIRIVELTYERGMVKND